MKTLTFKFCFILFIVLASCSKDEQAVLPGSSSSSELINALDRSEWKLTGCPDNTFLMINGSNECQYLDYLNFINDQVYIRNSVSNYLIPHYICFATSSKLTVSIQACENTTWKSLFEWNVISMTSNMLVLDVRVPNLDPGYKQRFTFTKQ